MNFLGKIPPININLGLIGLEDEDGAKRKRSKDKKLTLYTT